LHRNDLTAESAEGTEEEKREMNNSDTNGFDIRSPADSKYQCFYLFINKVVYKARTIESMIALKY